MDHSFSQATVETLSETLVNLLNMREPSDYMATDAPVTLDSLKKIVTSKNVGLWVLSTTSTPIGYCLTHRKSSPEFAHRVHIQAMGIASTYRGKGFGKALLNEVLTILATDPTFTLCTLEVVAENKPAVGLYVKQGFQIFGTLPGGFVKDNNAYDVLSMVRRLR